VNASGPPRAALPAACARTRELIRGRNQNNPPGGAARAPSGAVRRILLAPLPPVRVNPLDELRFFNARDDLQRPPQRTHCSISNTPLVHASRFRLRRRGTLARSGSSSRWSDRRAHAVRCEHPMKPRQVHPRRRHERR